MPIPDYETLMLPVLKQFENGAKNVAEIVPALKVQFSVSDEEAAEMLPSGRVTVLQSRAHWARTYLSKAGCLESPKRNLHVITNRGRELLTNNPSRIENSTLVQFDDFAAWKERSANVREKSPSLVERGRDRLDSQTPEDAMESAFSVIAVALHDEMLTLVHGVSSVGFEMLILDLLIAMGYGGGRLDRKRMTARSADGGIDGVIDEDALGLDAVYIQAKQFGSAKVGRPDLQKFVGSLSGEGASKGVFVTTTDFSREAQDYVRTVQQRIRMINGEELARLMIQHNVGVRPRLTYTLKSVDEDYFSNL